MRLAVAALLIFVQLTTTASADSAPVEIAYLLRFIRESPCTFIRNGSDYDGAAAADHVEAKYEHFKAEIKTAEDFIDRAATKSLMSGAIYKVRCGNAPTLAAAEWLRSALSAYRAQHPSAPAP
jgi:hypothetical protein